MKTTFDPRLITVCTTCMNRNEYLVRALPTWLERDFKEIVIVDWSSEKKVIDDVKPFVGERIKVVRVNGQKIFNCTKSRNLAVSLSYTPYIWLVDSDVKMTYKKPPVDLKPGMFYHGAQWLTGAPTTGTCLMAKSAFDSVNGYSEIIITLPGEDLDLYKRLKKSGYKRKYFPFGSLKHIYHPYNLRTKYRPWYGMSRAAGTRVTFEQVRWSTHHKQLPIEYEIHLNP